MPRNIHRTRNVTLCGLLMVLLRLDVAWVRMSKDERGLIGRSLHVSYIVVRGGRAVVLRFLWISLT